MGNEPGASEGGNGSTISDRNSEHKIIRPKDAKRLEGTAINDNEGRPLAVYHFTPNMEFIIFENGDIGFHFGTKEQAVNRGLKTQAGNGRVFRVYLNIKKPLQVNWDLMSWHAPAAAIKLWNEGTSYIAFSDDQIIKTRTQDVSFTPEGTVEWGEEREVEDGAMDQAALEPPGKKDAPESEKLFDELFGTANPTEAQTTAPTEENAAEGLPNGLVDNNIVTPDGQGREYTSKFR